MSAFMFGLEPRYRAISATGAPIPGAVLRFSVSPGTTPTDPYATSALTTPVTTTEGPGSAKADAGGLFDAIYLDSEITYRVRLFTSAGVLVWDQDVYEGLNLTQAAIGLVLYPRTAAEIAAGVTPTNYAYPEYHIHRYGAVGDGTTDDSSAWNAAKSLGKIILGGAGFSYYTPTGFLIASTNDNLHVIGNGSTLKMSTTNSVSNISGIGEATLSVDSADGVLLDDLVIDCGNVASSNTNSKGIASDNASNFTVRRVRFTNGGQMQVYATGLVVNHRYEKLSAATIGYGILVNEPDAAAYGLYVDGCEWDLQGSGQSDGVEVNAPTNGFRLVRVSDCVVKRAYGNALNAGIGFGFARVIDGLIADSIAEDCSNDGFHVEDDCEDFKVLNPQSIGCAWDTSATGSITVLTASKRVQIVNPTAKKSATKNPIAPPINIYSGTGEYCEDVSIEGGTVQDGDGANIQWSNVLGLRIHGVTSINPDIGAAGHGHFRGRRFFASEDSEGVVISGCTTTDGAEASTPTSFPDSGAVNGMRLLDNDFAGCATPVYALGTSNQIDARGNKFSRTVGMTGTVTLTAGTSTVVTNANADQIARIRIWPNDAASMALGLARVSAITRGTSFTITHAAAAGTESYGYEIS